MTTFLDKPLWRHAAASVAIVTTLGAFGWGGVKPHLEDFIIETAEQKIEGVKRATDQVHNEVRVNNNKIQQIINEQERAKVERQNIKDLAKEQRDLSRSILFELRKP